MNKSDIIIEECLEIEKIYDQTFIKGIRRNRMVKKVEPFKFCYGIIYFKNGLKLKFYDEKRMFNPPRLYIESKLLKADKKYRVKYRLTWRGKTKYYNGEIIEIIELNVLKPSERFQQYTTEIIPESVEHFLNTVLKSTCYFEKYTTMDDLRKSLLKPSYSLTWLEEKIWLAKNIFKLTNEYELVLLEVLKVIKDKSDFYKGVPLNEIGQYDELKEYDINSIKDVLLELVKNNSLISPTNDGMSVFPKNLRIDDKYVIIYEKG